MLQTRLGCVQRRREQQPAVYVRPTSSRKEPPKKETYHVKRSISAIHGHHTHSYSSSLFAHGPPPNKHPRARCRYTPPPLPTMLPPSPFKASGRQLVGPDRGLELAPHALDKAGEVVASVGHGEQGGQAVRGQGRLAFGHIVLVPFIHVEAEEELALRARGVQLRKDQAQPRARACVAGFRTGKGLETGRAHVSPNNP